MKFATVLCAALAGFGVVRSEELHVVFPVPGHPDYPQDVRSRTFTLMQTEKRSFTYSYRARAEGMDPATPPGNSNFGMNMCVRYMDGSVKWFDPGRESGEGFRLSGEGVRPSPVKQGWQELSGKFVPPRAVSNVTMYCRIARPGKAWFDGLKIAEHEKRAESKACTFKERKGYIQLANDFIRLIVDPAHGGTVARLWVKTNGVEYAAPGRGGRFFGDAFEGQAGNTNRVYEVIRRRDTPSSAEVTLRLTGPAGHQFLQIEKTFKIFRERRGVEVTRRYRNLPAAMSDVEITVLGESGRERIAVPLGGSVARKRVFFGDEDAPSGVGEQQEAAGPHGFELSRELVTAHTPWLCPYALGPTRALFILDLRQQREIVELAQRMDLDFESVRIAYVWENMGWGMIERYSAYSFADMNRDLAEKLKDGKYDVIVMAGRLWERLDEANRSTVSSLLASGTGLVAVETPPPVFAEYRETKSADGYILRNLPAELLPFGADRVKTYTRGRSRAVLLEYKAFDGLTPFVYYNLSEPPFFYADYILGMVAKSLLWAGRRELDAPAGAKEERSVEDTGEGRQIERTIFTDAKGRRYDFACRVVRGTSTSEAADSLRRRRAELEFPSAPTPWPDFPFSIGECCHRNGIKRYLLPLRYAQLKKLGVNQIRFWAVDAPDHYRPYFKYNLGFDFPVGKGGQLEGSRFQREFSEPYAKTGDRKYLCRRPCLNDAGFLAEDLKKVRETVKRLSPLYPASYDCGDENSLTRWSAEFDFCFSGHCLAEFRRWLKECYMSLDELNAAWGTGFKSWQEVMPDTAKESRRRNAPLARKAYGAWADHRRFMELTYARYFMQVKSEVQKLAPGTRFDMSGTQPPNGWTGMDMWLIGKVVDLPALYDVENLGEIIRSFRRPFAHPWFGYRFDGARGRWRAWNDAFRFLDFGISFYHEGLMLMPDYTIPVQVAELGEALVDLRAGGARLLRSLEAEEEALVHYSQASVHAAQIENRYADFLGVRDVWCRRLVASGVQFRFVAYEEIEQGILDSTGAKAVILPHSAALSAKEVGALRRFAARGGRVIGDAHSARMDEHCRELAENPLADAVVTAFDFGPEIHDGIRVFKFRSRLGLPGAYYGFTRDVDGKGAEAARKIKLPRKGFVYDLRRKRALGLRAAFDVALKPSEAAFFAVLPYRVESMTARLEGMVSAGGTARISLSMQVSEGLSAFHPVKADVYDREGRLLEAASGMTEIIKGTGEWKFKVPAEVSEGGRAVFTDFITGRTAGVNFNVE